MLHSNVLIRRCFSTTTAGFRVASTTPSQSTISNLEDAILSNKPFLVDSKESYFPQSLNPFINPDFPKVFTFDERTSTTIGKASRQLIDTELCRYGAIVLRGLPIRTAGSPEAPSFSNFLHSTGYNLTKYVGGVTLRPESEPMVYPASDEDSRVCMDLHQDNTYWPNPPHKLFFFYEQPAVVGGLNPLLDMRSFVEMVPSHIVTKLERLGIRYESFYPDAAKDDRFVSWQRSFGTTNRSEVENVLQAQAEEGVRFQWTTGGGLRKWTVLSPFKTHPVTGDKVWVNMIQANHASYFHDHPSFPELAGIGYSDDEDTLARIKARVSDFEDYPFHIRYGDGTPIEYREVIQVLRGIAWEQARVFRPQVGDILVIDNYLTQHGRLGYDGPRKVWIGISLS